MNWNQLQYIKTIAEEGNITKAAQKLYISQPSLSLSIQSLEAEMGVTLLERNHGKVTLTYAGSLFYDWAISIMHSRTQLNRKMNDISNGKRSLIHIGISPHRSLFMLPYVLERFYMIYPECEVRITEKPTYILKTLLEKNEIDFMIDVPHPDTVNYESELLTEEQIILAVPASYFERESFCRKEKAAISLIEMTSYPFIMLTSDQILGNISRKICEATNFFPNVRLTCENVSTALAMVKQQLGITFVPEIFAHRKEFIPDIQYFPIEGFHDTRKLCLVYPKNRYQHLLLQSLLNLFREMVPVLYQD